MFDDIKLIIHNWVVGHLTDNVPSGSNPIIRY